MPTNTIPLPRDILEAPFPPELVKTRPGAFGASLSYLEGHTVIGRLNDAFEGGWSFEIIEHQILTEEVVVLVKLHAESTNVTKMAFGSSKLSKDRNGNAGSIGDDLKAAATDALKKAATLLGVGLSLYGSNASTGDDDQATEDQPMTRTVPRNGNGRSVVPNNVPARSNGNGNHANGDDNGNGRVTSKQLAAIFAIARDRRMSNSDVREMTKQIFNKLPDYLSKSEASGMIEHLLAQ